MNVLIIGASGRTGGLLVQKAVALGHTVTAFVRDPRAWAAPKGVRVVQGDARDPGSLGLAAAGQDAVLSAFGPKSLKKGDVQEALMRNLVAGMRKAGVKRIVNLSAVGILDSAPEAPFFYRTVLMPLYVKHVFTDKTRGEELLIASGLEYTNVRPGYLLNRPARGGVKAALSGKGLKFTMTRADLADFMLAQLTDPAWIGRSPMIGY